MSLIAADEFIILMDFPEMVPLDDLKRIRETGVRTLYAFINWAQIERQPGVYDWQALDAWIDRAAAANMKVLLRCYERAPAFFPDDWYLWSADGKVWRERSDWVGEHTVLSPWCAEAMAAEAEFMQLCRDRFSSERVELFAGVVHDGEVILPGQPTSYYDPHAVADFKNFIAATSHRDEGDLPVDLPTYETLETHPVTAAWLGGSLYGHVAAQQERFPEIWLSLVQRNTQFSEMIESGPRTGNWIMRKLCRDLPAELGKDLNVLLFEVYRGGGIYGALDNVRGYEGRTWVGSQYCEGLQKNTDDAIDRGLRGFITAPIHPDLRKGAFEPWMLDAFRWSLERWRNARGVGDA